MYQTGRITFASATEAPGLVPELDVVFELWTEAFLRIAMPISREQELHADALAVRVAGVERTVSALTRLNAQNPLGDVAESVAGWVQNLHETHPQYAIESLSLAACS